MNVFCCGLFHTLLLFVPTNTVDIQYPPANINIVDSAVHVSWEPCNVTNAIYSPLQNRSVANLRLMNCSDSCPAADACNLLSPYCTQSEDGQLFTLSDLIAEPGSVEDGRATFDLKFRPDPCSSNIKTQSFVLSSNCSTHCKLESNIIRYCSVDVGEGRLTTNAVYFFLRMFATMALACCFIMLDAQTIQMCTVEEEMGNKGAYGRQILYKTLAQAIISPLVGLLMDKITAMTGSTNYVAPFVIHDILLVCTSISICFIQKDIGLPKDSDTMKGLWKIATNVSCMIFLFMMFVIGGMYGFVETFLFVFLKEDLGAPIYLLGLTITTGALVSVPFLYYSDFLVDKFGMVNVIIWALLMYGVRYVGYSFITCAWYAFPFEALEVFTLYLLRVGSAKYVKVTAPPGTLATLTGLSGGAHFGFGKGMGGLVGGVLKDQFSSTAFAFRVFGIAAFAFGLLYGVFHGLYGRRVDKRHLEKMALEAEKLKMTPFLETEQPIIKK